MQDAVPIEDNSVSSPVLDPVEIRVLGVLIEKESTTPEQYPLTLNSVRLGANQKTSRFPVVDYDEPKVRSALSRLEQKGFVRSSYGAGSRVTKYTHTVDQKLLIGRKERALLGLLLLRGAQTLGELRTRSERIYSFSTLTDVEETLDRLSNKSPSLVALCMRLPGQKEDRYVHRLGECPQEAADSGDTRAYTRSSTKDLLESAYSERIASLEKRIDAQAMDIAHLREAVEELKQRVLSGA